MGEEVRHFIQPTKRKLDKAARVRLAVDLSNGMTKVAAAKKYGINVRTLYRIFEKQDPEPDVKPPPRHETRRLQPHGTNAAYMRHIRKDEPACLLCVDAHALAIAAWRRGENPTKLREQYDDTTE